MQVRTLVGCAVLGLVSSGARVAQPILAQAGPRIYDVTVAKGVEAGRPVAPGAAFTPDTNPIYVWFRHEGLAAGARVTAVWYYLEPASPLRIADASMIIQPPTDWGQFNFELAAGKRWPLGAYRVELLVDGQPAAQAPFEVSLAAGPSPSPPAPRNARVHTATRGAFQIAVPEGWTMRADLPNADVQLTLEQDKGLIEITSGPTSIKLDPVSYAAGWESVSVGPGQRLQAKRGGRERVVGGEPAYEGLYEGEGVLARVVFAGRPDRFVVLTGVFPAAELDRLGAAFDEVLTSFVFTAR